MTHFSKKPLEFLRTQAKHKFDKVRTTWLDLGKWAAPHRIKWLSSQVEGQRNNNHIVDSTHIIALRSFVAGFLEGNTSATRPWFRLGTQDKDLNKVEKNKAWLQKFTERTLLALSSSNYYDAAALFYNDYGVFNTGAHYIDELEDGLHFHTLVPGSYFLINDAFNKPVVLVREFSYNVKAVVDKYARREKGRFIWDNISNGVRKMYEDGNFTEQIDVVHIIKSNDDFNPDEPQILMNREWHSFTYELGGELSIVSQHGQEGIGELQPEEESKFLTITGSKRKPFIVGKSDSSNFEYGEKGPTLDALGLIKSLNKKAIGKDQALEQMLRPALQGPANLRKSYITTASNSFVPIDVNSLAKGQGLRTVFEINPAIGSIIQDVSDMRQQVDKLYFADFLLFLSQNPKTRTATETNAILNEQQLVIGPNLQSLNWTYNTPLVNFVMDYVLFEDPFLEPPPEDLGGQLIEAEFISVFAQAQRAADLPSIERFAASIGQLSQIKPGALDKLDADVFADLLADRLFLPAGLNKDQSKVDAERQQAQANAQRQQLLQETLPALSSAAKNVGIKVNQ